MEKKKVLILGGTGFIGLNIVKALVKRTGYEITIADNLSRGQEDSEVISLTENHGVRLIKADFIDPASFSLLQKEYDFLYMLASVVGVNYTLQHPHEIIRINTFLILNTLEWLRQVHVRKVLFTSTSECYAGTIDSFGYKVPTDEKIPLCISDISHPRYTYAVTKMLGESGFLNYARMLGFQCTVVRYHNVYGPRMGYKHVIPHLVERFIQKENPFQVYGYDQTRSFCYIDDAVQGTIAAMETATEQNEIFHIGTMEEVTIEHLIRETGKLLGFTGEYINAPTYPGSVSKRCPDIAKAQHLLGYYPKISLLEGLEKTVNWYQHDLATRISFFEKGFEKPKHDHV